MNRSVFSRQLRYWSFHCSLNALPSFCIALSMLNLWKSPSGIAAMICGVATFILIYSTVTSLFPVLSSPSGWVATSLRIGTKIRSSLAAMAILSILISLGMLYLGFRSGFNDVLGLGWCCEFWCGAMANGILENLVRAMRPWVLQFGFGTVTVSFMKIYLTTVIEGFILSSILLAFSTFAAIFIRVRESWWLFRLEKPV
jgi:hypothetical protein